MPQVVKDAKWQKLREELKGSWTKTPDENCKKLRAYVGDMKNVRKVRQVQNYLTGTYFRTHKNPSCAVTLRKQLSDARKKYKQVWMESEQTYMNAYQLKLNIPEDFMKFLRENYFLDSLREADPEDEEIAKRSAALAAGDPGEEGIDPSMMAAQTAEPVDPNQQQVIDPNQQVQQQAVAPAQPTAGMQPNAPMENPQQQMMGGQMAAGQAGMPGMDPNAAAGGAMPGMDAMGGMGGGMGGMDPNAMGAAGMDPNMAPPATPEEVGRMYETKKLYYRLKTLQGILSSNTDPELIELKKVVDEAMEIFQLVVDNIGLYKDKIDEFIIYYYKFVYRLVKILDKHYQTKFSEKKNKNKEQKQNDATIYVPNRVDDSEKEKIERKVSPQLYKTSKEENTWEKR
jgi:hypothetical protein